MGVNFQATAWQLTPISYCCCVWDLGGFCCELLGQNRTSNTQQALHEHNQNDGGGNDKKNIFLVAPATLPKLSTYKPPPFCAEREACAL
eukprot:4758793-Ditylum_brightwellii.AAC.1